MVGILAQRLLSSIQSVCREKDCLFISAKATFTPSQTVCVTESDND